MKRSHRLSLAVALAAVLLVMAGYALARLAAGTLTLASLVADGMVLQRDTSVTIAGHARPGWPVVLAGTWGALGVARAGPDGGFRTALRTGAAGGPYRLLVWAGEAAVVRNVWIGETWLCSGQSNMEQPVGRAEPDTIPDVPGGPPIRLFTVPLATAARPQDRCQGGWEPASADAVRAFSAVCWHFGRALHDALGVPLGLVAAAVGSSEIELWTSERGLRAIPELAAEIDAAPPAAAGDVPETVPADRTAGDAASSPPAFAPRLRQRYSLLFNAMIAPLAPYTLRGVIWYQGESNVARAAQYARTFPAMIRDWRTWFGRDLPFGYVQLQPFGGYPPRGAIAELRDAQRRTLTTPATGMVVTIDLGDPTDIHSTDKSVVGSRLARWALARVYGHATVVASGPLYRDMQVDGPRASVFFEHANGGLVAPPIPMGAFELAGADHRYVPALAEVQGEKIVVRSPWLEAPVAVRFAWADVPTVTLRNQAGLPASPFRSDDWSGITDGVSWQARWPDDR